MRIGKVSKLTDEHSNPLKSPLHWDATVHKKLEILLEHKNRVSANITELQTHLQNLDEKINIYQEKLLKK